MLFSYSTVWLIIRGIYFFHSFAVNSLWERNIVQLSYDFFPGECFCIVFLGPRKGFWNTSMWFKNWFQTKEYSRVSFSFLVNHLHIHCMFHLFWNNCLHRDSLHMRNCSIDRETYCEKVLLPFDIFCICVKLNRLSAIIFNITK